MKTFAKIKSGAFTLIELLAAMTITTALVLVIVALTSRGVDIWRLVLQDVRTTTLARTAMDTMTKDFESMQFRAGNPFEWMVVQRDSDLAGRSTKTASSTRGRGRASSGLEPRVNVMTMGPEGAKITNASQLIFFTTATDRNPAKSSMDMRSDRIIGDVNCVGYKLIYRDQILDRDATAEGDGFPVYSLYRNLVSAEDTVRDLLGKEDLWSAYSRFQQDETVPANFLVENVVEMTLIFEVDYQKKIGNSGSNKSDKDASQRASVLIPVMTTGANRLGSCSQMDVYGNRLDVIGSSMNIDDLKSGRVTGVTISMTVVTDEGMALVDQIRKGRPAPTPEEFFERYTRSFTQRVALPLSH